MLEGIIDKIMNILGSGLFQDYSMYNIIGSTVQLLKITVVVNSPNLQMEVDIATSIINGQTYNQLWAHNRRPNLQPTAIAISSALTVENSYSNCQGCYHSQSAVQ